MSRSAEATNFNVAVAATFAEPNGIMSLINSKGP